MASLPSYAKLLAEGYQKVRDSAVNRTPFEDGMVKQSRFKARVLIERSISLGFDTLADYQAFITWFQDTIDYGAMWFDFTDPEDGVLKQARIVSQLESERPIFGAGVWRIAAKIETWSS